MKEEEKILCRVESGIKTTLLLVSRSECSAQRQQCVGTSILLSPCITVTVRWLWWK